MRYILGTLTILAFMWGPGTSFAAGGHDEGGHAHGSDMSKGPIASYRELSEEEAIIQDVLDTYGRAMEERSVAMMEQALIAGDFSTIESGYPNWSWEDFRDSHLAVEMNTFTDVDYDIGLIVGEFQGSLGFAIFQYTASGKAGEKTISISGLGTAILEETADGWKIHHMHTSAPRDQLAAAAGDRPAEHGGEH